VARPDEISKVSPKMFGLQQGPQKSKFVQIGYQASRKLKFCSDGAIGPPKQPILVTQPRKFDPFCVPYNTLWLSEHLEALLGTLGFPLY
jgi:hypothetical protein